VDRRDPAVARLPVRLPVVTAAALHLPDGPSERLHVTVGRPAGHVFQLGVEQRHLAAGPLANDAQDAGQLTAVHDGLDQLLLDSQCVLDPPQLRLGGLVSGLHRPGAFLGQCVQPRVVQGDGGQFGQGD
jgi:hypothetical protein